MSSVTFKSDDWLYVKAKIEELLKNHRSALEQSSSTYKTMLESRAKIEILRTLLNLPEQLIPANKG